ncbi:MAG TPA: T9SS type A sorting domain-containing protein [Ignavibacteriales bacterium]|nr:T9SS type A sorting domain-containing protein [Ignavibacteriales bacterium]
MKRNATFPKMNNFYMVIIFALVILCTKLIYSYPNGVSGYTLKSGTTGCYCHGSSSSTVTVAINGPSTLKTGETGNYTVTISGGSGTAVGTDIAASNGTLANADNNLKVLNGELTQTSAKSFSGGKYIFSFKYTAPSAPGTQTLYSNGVSTKPQWNFAPNFTVNVQDGATGVKDQEEKPQSYGLEQNYPNPFNPATVISYQLPKESVVKLAVYNSIGEEVRRLADGLQEAGNHFVSFDGSNLTSGIYFYSIEAKSRDGNETFRSVKKMALLK